MNALGYFWDEYPLIQAEKRLKEIKTKAIKNGEYSQNVYVPLESKLSEGQKDLYEGTATICRLDKFGISESFKDYLFCNPVLRAEGYRYCNVACFYRLDCAMSKLPNQQLMVSYDIPQIMNEFGKYVVAILNEHEFIKRIGKAADALGYKFLCGNVQYHDLKIGNKTVVSGHRAILEGQEKISLNGEDVQILEQRDCFDKMANYQKQKEWRIALYRGERSTDAYVLKVGNLRDIVQKFSFENLSYTIDASIRKNPGCLVANRMNNWYGNTTRKELSDHFYKLGDYMGTPLRSVGKPQTSNT